jgi:hypothetical protein
LNYVLYPLLILCLALAACGPSGREDETAGQPRYGKDSSAKQEEMQDTVSTLNTITEGTTEHDNRSESINPAGTRPNVIRWSTASEHDSFGYDIYRGNSEDGPFSVINRELIPGAGTTDMPNRYEYIDDTVEPDITYWYYIESISLTGERKRITPVYPSKRKQAKDE